MSASKVTLIALGLGILGVLTWLVARDLSRNLRLARPWKRWLRLSRFAQDNGFKFVAVSARLPFSSSALAPDAHYVVTDRLVHRGKRLELGTLISGELDSLANPRARGYLAVGLNRALPHMVLRASANGRRRGIPGTIRKDQILSLEGDFDRYFTLYAPRAYERDALYVFAPDLMALLIDEAATYDVEIVDNWIIFYSPRAFDFGSPQTVRRLLHIEALVGAKTLRQTDRYWDGRDGASFRANHVAAAGRRLRIKVAVGISGFLLLALLLHWSLRAVARQRRTAAPEGTAVLRIGD